MEAGEVDEEERVASCIGDGRMNNSNKITITLDDRFSTEKHAEFFGGIQELAKRLGVILSYSAEGGEVALDSGVAFDCLYPHPNGGTSRIAAIKAIRTHTGFGLKVAKDITELHHPFVRLPRPLAMSLYNEMVKEKIPGVRLLDADEIHMYVVHNA